MSSISITLSLFSARATVLLMLLQVAGYAGGLYVARTYLRERLEQLKEKMEIERAAKDK